MKNKLEPLLNQVVAHTGIESQYILSEKRDKEIVEARHLFVYLAREKAGASYPSIARFLNKKDHSSIIHAFNKINKLIEEGDKETVDLIGNMQFAMVTEPTNRFKYKHDKLYKELGVKCMVCGFDDVIEVHHIVPLKRGGSNHSSNVLILCPNHHSLLHAGLLNFKSIGVYKYRFSTE